MRLHSRRAILPAYTWQGADVEILDCVGVPEYFVTRTGTVEDAGDGLIRAVNCICRGGVLIPVFSVVRPAASILQDAVRFRDLVQKIACGAIQKGGGGAVH